MNQYKTEVYSCKSCDNSGVVQYLDSSGDDFILDYCPHCLEGLRAKKAETLKILSVSFIESEGEVNVTKK